MTCCLKVQCLVLDNGRCRDRDPTKRHPGEGGTWTMLQNPNLLVHMYLLIMVIRNKGTNYCPGAGEVACWQPPKGFQPFTKSSNQSPAIALYPYPPEQKANDLDATWSYLNDGVINAAETNDPLARLFASSQQLVPAVESTPSNIIATNYASPQSENFEISPGNEEGLQAPGEVFLPSNLFLDPIV